jgi:hypothetical protein
MFVNLFAGGVEAWRVIKAFPFLQRQLTLNSGLKEPSVINC